MPISVTCPNGHKIKAEEKLAGRTVRCPKCKAPLTIPAAEAEEGILLEVESFEAPPETQPAPAPTHPATEDPLGLDSASELMPMSDSPTDAMPMAGGPGAGEVLEGIPLEGVPLEGVPFEGVPIQEQPMQGMPAQGMPAQGMPAQGMPAQGMPMQGMPMQGVPGQAMPAQGAPMHGMPAQGVPTQGVPAQGMPAQGMPMPAKASSPPWRLLILLAILGGLVVIGGVVVVGAILFRPKDEAPAEASRFSPDVPLMEWRDVNEQAGDFTVSLPGEPERAVNAIPTDVGRVEVTMLALDMGPMGAFVVAYGAYPPDSSYRNVEVQHKVISGVIEGMVSSKGAQVKQQSRITLNGNPGQECQINLTGSQAGTYRVYMCGNKFYQLISYWDYTAPGAEEASKRFLDSFQLPQAAPGVSSSSGPSNGTTDASNSGAPSRPMRRVELPDHVFDDPGGASNDEEDRNAPTVPDPVDPNAPMTNVAGEEIPTLHPTILQEIVLPAPAIDMCVGGGGRYMILHCGADHGLIVCDLQRREIVGEIGAAEDCLFAANATHLLVLSPSDWQLTRYSLSTLEVDKQDKLEKEGIPLNLTMGHSSNGPASLYWKKSERVTPRYSLIDADNYEIRELMPLSGRIGPGEVGIQTITQNEVRVTASPDGDVFCLRVLSTGTTVERVFVGSSPTSWRGGLRDAGHAIPSTNGHMVFTGDGFLSSGLVALREDEDESGPAFPTPLPNYFVTLGPSGLKVRETQSRRAVLGMRMMPELGTSFLAMAKRGDRNEPNDLLPEQRVHCHPAENLLVTIPSEFDRLLLREIPFDKIEPIDESPTRTEIMLPGITSVVVTGRSGRHIACQLKEQERIAVVDLVSRELVGTVPAREESIIEASSNHLVIIDPIEKQVSRYNLLTLDLEETADLDLGDAIPRAIALGNSSNGPALVQWSNESGGAYSLLDLETLQLEQLTATPGDASPPEGLAEIQLTGGRYFADNIFASMDGRMFGITHHSSSNFSEIYTLGDSASVRHPVDVKYLYPSDTLMPTRGSVLHFKDGRLTTRTGSSGYRHLPTAEPHLILRFDESRTELMSVSNYAPVATLPAQSELDRYIGSDIKYGYRGALKWHQRYHVVPSDSILAFVPLTDDRVVITGFNSGP